MSSFFDLLDLVLAMPSKYGFSNMQREQRDFQPLREASLAGRHEICQELLDLGVNANGQNNYEESGTVLTFQSSLDLFVSPFSLPF